jgi:hypothetical protein
MATSCTINMVTAFDASGQICLQMITDDEPQEVMERPRVAVARQDLEEGEPPFLCISFSTPEKRFIFSVEFNDAARLAAILTSHAIAEQLTQDRERAKAAEARSDEDGEDGDRHDEDWGEGEY